MPNTVALSYDLGAMTVATGLNAICVKYGYSSTLSDGSANPETQAQFVRRMYQQQITRDIKDGLKLIADQTISPVTVT